MNTVLFKSSVNVQWMSQPLSEIDASFQEKLSHKDYKLGFADKHNNDNNNNRHLQSAISTNCSKRCTII